MSFSTWLLGKPKAERDKAALEAENINLRRALDKFREKYIRARAHQEQLSDFRRITADQRLELHRLGKLLTAERRYSAGLRERIKELEPKE